MPASKTKQWVSTIKRRIAIWQMFPDVNDEPNQTVLAEMFDVDPLSINLDLKCIRAVRNEIAGLSQQYDEKMSLPAPAKPTRRKKWGRRVATVFGGSKETFKNQQAPERQDNGTRTDEEGANRGGCQ